MILQCSQCNARYLVPDHALGSKGRDVRCARCSHTWFEAAPKPTAEAMQALSDMIEQVNSIPKPIPSGSNLPVVKKRSPAMGWMAASLVMAIATTAFAMLLLVPNTLGLQPSKRLKLGDVVMTKTGTDENTAYQITGKIFNYTEDTMLTPTMRITLVDNEGTALQYWDFTGGKPIASKDAAVFDTGALEILVNRGTRFVVEIGNPLELSLRRKPVIAGPDTAPADAPTEKTS